MLDKELTRNTLQQIKTLVNTICERTANINDIDDFLCSPNGMVLLDAVCMNLIAIGEAVKNLDKVSNGELLPLYPQLQWSGIMRMRDKIAHHYFEIDAEVVLLTVKEDIPLVKTTIENMLNDL
ncbi:MAG: DUF86 domain-containing protein [Bacteroidales bacterium]|nr:DUF86 domain-containing protein [Bacteroidales bacterium]